MKELIIHFDNLDVIFNSLKENNVDYDTDTLLFLIDIHNSVSLTKTFCDIKTQREICFRASNHIIKHFDVVYGVKFKKYTKQNWL